MRGKMSVIEAKNLTKYYGDFLAVNNISFSVEKGEIFGFLGPNGAGKTTTIRMLTGILEASKGKIRVLGYDMRTEKIKAREKMGIVPEMANPYIDITAMQNLELIGGLYGMKKADIRERGEYLLKLFGIYEKKDRKARGLSKGMKQRLSLAMAMLPDPEILFLDEPTSGLDVMSARMIKKIIRDENKKGKTIFMNTHNMEDANELCTKIGIINRGRMVAIDTPEKIKKIGRAYVVVEASFDPFRFDETGIESAERIEIMGDKARIYAEDPDAVVKELVDYAEKNGLKIISLNTQSPSLEDVFMNLVGGGKNE
jgi:ABC-2 type transport system ATP-binding protein